MEGKHVQEIVFEMSMHVNKMYMSGPSGRDTVIEAQCFEKTDFPISFILSLWFYWSKATFQQQELKEMNYF